MSFLDMFKRPAQIRIGSKEELLVAESQINQAQNKWEKLPTFIVTGEVYSKSEKFWLWWDGHLTKSLKEAGRSLPGLLLNSPLAIAKLVGRQLIDIFTKNRILEEKMEELIPDAVIRRGIRVILTYDYRFGGVFPDKNEVLIVARMDTYDT